MGPSMPGEIEVWLSSWVERRVRPVRHSVGSHTAGELLSEGHHVGHQVGRAYTTLVAFPDLLFQGPVCCWQKILAGRLGCLEYGIAYSELVGPALR